MFESATKLAFLHRKAIQDAYTEGYHADITTSNPYRNVSQTSRYHAWLAGRYDKSRGFAYAPLEVPIAHKRRA